MVLSIGIELTPFTCSLTDSIRKYFTVMFLTHMSFIFSVLAAYLTYVIGVEMAVEERVSVLLFFTNIVVSCHYWVILT